MCRQDAFARKGSFIPEFNPFTRDVALWRAIKPGRSVVQVRGAFLAELASISQLCIYPNWRLAGEHMLVDQWAGLGFWRGDYKDHLHRLKEFGVDLGQAEEIRQAIGLWSRRCDQFMASVGELDEADGLGLGNWGSAPAFLASVLVENHSQRDYAKMLRIGFGGIERQLRLLLVESDIADAEYPQKSNFWKAGLYVCQAAATLSRRYAELAESMAAQAIDDSERERLSAMAQACRRVPMEGARTLAEAVQSIWLGHVLTGGEDGLNANGLGRLDQILQPYYQADVSAGLIDRAGATELIEELWLKLYQEYETQAATIGGLDRAGRCAANEMTYIILDATRNVDFARDVSIRVHRNSPPELIRQAAAMLARGGGVPFFFNDEALVPALADRGIALEDARDYAPIGCIEPTIPGKANPHAASGYLNAVKCLELAIHDGLDTMSGKQLGPHTGAFESFKTYEQFLEAFKAQLECITRRMVHICNRAELYQRERGPLPLWSLLTDDCIARGRDINDGGAIYNYTSVGFVGTANVADGLTAVRKLVFEEKAISPRELVAALRADFDGYEPLRQALLTMAPKYGNGVAEVDAVAAWLDEHFIRMMDGFRTPLGGRYVVHLFSFRCNIDLGKTLGATPDGRKAGQPVAYSLSAHQGRDRKGVTAMIESLSRLPHNQAAGATAAIIDLDPKVVSGPRGTELLAGLIRAAMDLGIGQLQMNVVTAERLRLAQQDPENHGNIIVRVAGYSQRFNLLTQDLQELVISRTKHTS